MKFIYNKKLKKHFEKCFNQSVNVNNLLHIKDIILIFDNNPNLQCIDKLLEFGERKIKENKNVYRFAIATNVAYFMLGTEQEIIDRLNEYLKLKNFQ